MLPLKKINIDFAFLVLMIFVFFRPLFSTEVFTTNGLFGLSFREVFGLTISYSFLFCILLKRFYSKIDAVAIVTVIFITYASLSIAWGSQPRDITRLVFPFLTFYATRISINDERKLRLLYLIIIIGFSLPVILSFSQIIMGKSVSKVIYWTGLIRYSGAYYKTHELAHEMLIFLCSCSLFIAYNYDSNKGKRKFIYFICIMAMMALFNLYRTYVRTVYLGLITMFFFYLLGSKKYLVLIIGAIMSLSIGLFSADFSKIMYDIIEPLQGKRSIEWLGSGRIAIWLESIKDFSTLPVERYFLGSGLGNENISGGLKGFGSSHNDFLSILNSLGIIGLGTYLGIYLVIIRDIMRSTIEKKTKNIYFGYFVAVIVMDFVSNSYVSRFELSQYFFFIMGTFYTSQQIENDKVKNDTMI